MLIADDQPMVRDGLRRILTAAPDVEVVAEAADGAAAGRPGAVLAAAGFAATLTVTSLRHARR
ncbi:MAG: hypothetical protein JWM93_2660 [Frankiales bacterium]|nr:hypothetical protein [Frankiales bacterium]